MRRWLVKGFPNHLHGRFRNRLNATIASTCQSAWTDTFQQARTWRACVCARSQEAMPPPTGVFPAASPLKCDWRTGCTTPSRAWFLRIAHEPRGHSEQGHERSPRRRIQATDCPRLTASLAGVRTDSILKLLCILIS